MRDAARAATAAGSFRLEDVTVRLGAATVLQGISVAVAPGEAVALVGPSGAGKTTLLRLLNGGVAPAAGRVVAEGRDLSTLAGRELRRQRARIGVVHQDLRLVPGLRVSQNVLSGGLGRLGPGASLRLFLRPRREDLERVHAILERVGIADKMFERVDRLSGGQAQRVAVARALYQSPGILLADEPVASVDPARARSVLGLLTDICRADGLTLCVSLHDAGLVREFFPRVVGLREGRLAFDAPTADLDPRDMAALFRLEDRQEDRQEDSQEDRRPEDRRPEDSRE